MRNITPIIKDQKLSPAVLKSKNPEFVFIDPKSLLIDNTYQRELTHRSIKLIRYIVENWNWAYFKPPVVTMVDGDFHIIDGQHTTIAAATHGGINEIPVMVVDLKNHSERAKAFISHNKMRLGMTAMNIFEAALASGDESATEIRKLCDSLKVKILKAPPQMGVYKPRETMAISALTSLVKKRGYEKAKTVIKSVADSNLAPVTAQILTAVDHILYGPSDTVHAPADITTTLINLGPNIYPEAHRISLRDKITQWKAAANIITNKMKKKNG